MLIDEAPSSNEPRMCYRRHSITYIAVIIFLTIVVILICINHILVYNEFTASKEKYTLSNQKYNTALDEKNELLMLSEGLQAENADLKEKYDRLFQQNEKILGQLEDYQSINHELSNKISRLEEDNIELQNTLKIAASAGVKPQNYTNFKGVNSRGDIDRGTYVGSFIGTAYTPSKDECGNNKGITNSGKPIIPGVSIAVDSKYWPFGTIFYIKGLGYAVAMDTGDAIKGKNRFDFAVFDKKFAMKLGQRNWEVYLIKLGNGKVGDIKF